MMRFKSSASQDEKVRYSAPDAQVVVVGSCGAHVLSVGTEDGLSWSTRPRTKKWAEH
jgi:hypothetical protein